MTKLKIQKIDTVTDRIRLFTLVAPDGSALSTYKAGAHIDFDLGEAGTRSYSLVDFTPPGDAPVTYSVAVQREDDGQGGSRAMHGLVVHDIVNTTAPSNDFQLHEGNAQALLIAGGIGVTPIISFAAELTARSTDFSFHYATRSASVCPFREQLQTHFGDTLTLWFDDQQMIDLDALINNASPDTHVYCCGPKGMIEAVRQRAEVAGIVKQQVHFELFTSPAMQAGDQSFEVEIADGRVFTIPADKTIIEVLEDNDVDVMYDCARGDCGICQTDVVSGTPEHRDVVLSDEERESGKIMQICVGRAKSARLVLNI